jgi:hypothetical protein
MYKLVSSTEGIDKLRAFLQSADINNLKKVFNVMLKLPKDTQEILMSN